MLPNNFLYKSEVAINDAISIRIPSVGEVLNNEEDYYNLVSLLTAMPIDLMVQLDDLGIDFTEINEYELFILLSGALKDIDMSLVFSNLDFSKFEPTVNQDTGSIFLINEENNVVIDRAVHDQIARVLRKIHHLEKNIKKPANKESKDYMMEKARKKLKRSKNRQWDSQLESLIVAMVNTEQYKYNYEETKNISIYQFNESVQQIIHKVDYDNKMRGIYAGTLDSKSLSRDDLNWLIHK